MCVADISYLEFSQCETSSDSCSSVILDCRALNDWSKSVDWSRSDSCGLCETSSSASVLSCWLVEMYSYSSLPILVEMGVGDDVIVLDCLCGGLACVIAGEIGVADHFDGSKTQQERVVEDVVEVIASRRSGSRTFLR